MFVFAPWGFHLTMDLARQLLEANMPSLSVLKMNRQRDLLYSLSLGIAHPTLLISSKHDLLTANHRGNPRRGSSVVIPTPAFSGRLGRQVWAAPHPCLVCAEQSPPSGAGHLEGQPPIASGTSAHSWFTYTACKTSKILPMFL